MEMQFFLLCIVLLDTRTLATTAAAATTNFSTGSQRDRDALLALKSDITQDPQGMMNSWNHSLNFCHWQGVTCGHKHRRVTILDLSSRALVGSLSPYIGNLSFVKEIRLDNNTLQGKIPHEFGRLFKLQALNLSINSLEEEVPANLSHCSNLVILDLSYNQLVGKIPMELASLSKLKILYLARNNLTGGIPSSIGNLTSLENFSASYNFLGGQIPDAFQRLGNLASLTLGGSEFFGESFLKVSYGRLLKATDGFSLENLIGVGSFGSVYKGILDWDGTVVAVKVLNLQHRGASKSFMAECEALRNIRHRNLVKIITSCSSADFQGNDFKALIYEFMPNGSLERWLHPILETDSNDQDKPQNLNLLQRINIAIDVACALDYLHHNCEKPIVHCDLKPSNILLDSDMTAHVGDFGLVKFLPELMIPNQSSSIGIRGTIGYAAPEYGLGSEVSTSGDVYSYGILLLELMTGKRPTDRIFAEGVNFHLSLHGHLEVLDL